MSADPAPLSYRVTIRRLIRFGLIGIAFGVILGLVWTEYRRSLRYGPELKRVAETEPKGSKIQLEVPPGYMFEAGLNFKLSHGHVTLIAGVLPLCFALCLHLAHAHGGKPIKASTLNAFFWLYAVGAAGTVALITYKGWASFLAFRAGAHGFDLSAIDRDLFGGSRAIRGAAYGLSHTLMAFAVGLFIHAIWRSSGGMGRELPATSPPASS